MSSNRNRVAFSDRFSPEKRHALVAIFSGDFARKGYLAAIDQGLISLANFLAAIYLARLVSPTEFGVYAVGFLLLHLVRAVQEGLVVQPISSLGAAMDRAIFRPYASNTAIIQLGLDIILSAGAAGLGWVLIRLGNDTAGPAIFSLWFVFLVWPFQEFIRRAMYARRDVRPAVINTALASAARLGVLWWVGVRGMASGQTGMDAIAWGALIAIPPGLWQARAYWTRHVSGLWQTWRRNWISGRWVLGGSLANWMALEVYPLLAASMISFAAAGAYRALQTPVAPVHLLLRATDTILTPRAAALGMQGEGRGLRRTLRLTYLITGLPILGWLVLVSLNAEQVMSLLYGDAYSEYSAGVVLMSIFYGLWFAYWPLQSVLKAIQRTLPIFVGNLAATAAMFTAGLLLIQRGGVYGTIAGQALNALIVNLVLWLAWILLTRKADQPAA